MFDLTMMAEYIKFYSDKHNIKESRVRKIFNKAYAVFGNDGWDGGEYHDFVDKISKTMQWKYFTNKKSSSFVNEDGIDFIKCYDYMQDYDLLRMLSYSYGLTPEVIQLNTKVFSNHLEHKYNQSNDMFENGHYWPKIDEIVIVDYGCGLAYWTIEMCDKLIKNNIPVKLILIDIYRKSFVEFLDYRCKKRKINYEFRKVTHNKLIPEIPECDYVHIMAVLEHTSEPVKVIESIIDSIRTGGIIFGTFYDDPFANFQHISADLSGARSILDDNENYEIKNLGIHWNPETTVYQVFKDKNIEV